MLRVVLRVNHSNIPGLSAVAIQATSARALTIRRRSPFNELGYFIPCFGRKSPGVESGSLESTDAVF